MRPRAALREASTARAAGLAATPAGRPGRPAGRFGGRVGARLGAHAPGIAGLAVVAALAGPLGLPGRATAAPPTWEEDLARADALFREARYPEAAKLLEQVLRARPDAAEAHRLLGHAYAELGRAAEARAALGRAIGWGRLSPDVLLRLAQLEEARGGAAAAASALALWELVAEAAPPSVRLVRAARLAELGRGEEAEALVGALLAEAPSLRAAHLWLAERRLEQGRDGEALVLLETALALGGADAGLHVAIGDLSARRGDPAGALATYATAALLDPARAGDLALRRARLDLARGRWAEAAAGAREALAAGAPGAPGAPGAEAALVLGRALDEAGRGDEAEATWLDAIERGARDPDLLRFLGRRLLRAERFAEAARILALEVESAGDAGDVDGAGAAAAREALALLVRAELGAGRAEAARAALTRYVALAGLDADARDLAAALATAAPAK